MAPFQFVPRSSARTNYFFPSIESLPLPTRCYPRSLAREGGGPISLIVGPLKGDEKEDDGERERGEGARERQEGRHRSHLGPRSPMVSMSLSPPPPPLLCPLIALFIYLLHPRPPSRIRRRKSNAPTAKVRGALTSLLFLLPSSSPFFLVRSFRGHFDSSHEISVTRREARAEREIPLVSARAQFHPAWRGRPLKISAERATRARLRLCSRPPSP